MKKLFTIVTAFMGFIHANAQAILNELYTIPGNSRNEFFEFYNNSITPASMDNYTMVTYFEEGSTKGFYVLDMPNLTVAAQGYFVGSSDVPFDYQGISNSTNSQFSWNDLAFLAAHNGYLKKWVVGTSVSAAVDGNASYDLATIPTDFNDFFNKIVGTGATYNVFVYNNGQLQSVFLGGTGGNTFLPTYITTLPSLNVDMSGSSPDFSINFSGYGGIHPEYVTQDVGTDNGYIRTSDGYCGVWVKSDNGTSHSPDATNGNTGTDPTIISVMSAVVRGNAVTGSTVNYDIVSAPVTSFPITLHIYVDNGTVPGQLDPGDTFIENKVENILSDGPFTSTFQPYTANIIIQTTTNAGCINKLMAIPNVGVLPIKLVSFQVTKSVQGNILSWQVEENEEGQLFEIERSADGTTFSKINFVKTTLKTGTESYSFTDANPPAIAHYRLKIIDKANKSSYSSTVKVENNTQGSSPIALFQNPVESYLRFNYSAPASTMSTVSVYNQSGRKVYSQQIALNQGKNDITIAADGRFYTGAYIVEVSSRFENCRAKFIKR
jgi:hypothetical protein